MNNQMSAAKAIPLDTFGPVHEASCCFLLHILKSKKKNEAIILKLIFPSGHKRIGFILSGLTYIIPQQTMV